ncbi:MAG: hypothetical protein C4326_15460, partial [Ignavibacteria bacterium]
MVLASIDIGTNTVLLLIARIDNDGTIVPLLDEQRLPRLGEGGPMFIKDRTFFFFSYEGLRDNARTLGFTRVLTQ